MVFNWANVGLDHITFHICILAQHNFFFNNHVTFHQKTCQVTSKQKVDGQQAALSTLSELQTLTFQRQTPTPGVEQLLWMTRWTLVKKWIASGVREPNVSKAKGTKICRFSAQALACLSAFFYSVFLATCLATNPFSLKPTKGETPVRSTQACFSPAQPSQRRADPLVAK
ncbi:hypothetical protein Hanom_Chr06g00514811 [Helianthus anomalus]